jgi:predicted component of type VI protein secretion system
MPAQLVALNDGPSILVDKPILLLGRHPECDIQIESRKISRRHCCIAQVDDHLVVRDLDSTNGIRINGVRVVEGQLHAGDELTVGNHRYQVTWGDEPAGPRPVAAAAPAPRPSPKAVPPPAEDDDELLEACDEPIALPDPGRAPARAAAPPRARPEPGQAESPADDDSVLIPENLELMPGSNVDLPKPTERQS